VWLDQISFRLAAYGLCFAVAAPIAGVLLRRVSFADRRNADTVFAKAGAGCAIAVFMAIAALSAVSVDGNLDWIQTLNTYLGPALRVMQGGVPLVDVFCQYGIFPYLVFSVIHSTVLPFSYPAAAFVVTATNAIYVGVASGILLKASRNASVAVATAAALTVLVVPAWNGIPSNGGLRFLPPLLVCLGIVLSTKRVSAGGVIALLICSIWSIEGFAWGLVVYFSTLILRLVHDRANAATWLREIAISAGAVVLAQALLMVAWLALFGSYLRYDIYLEIIASYSGNGWGAVPFSTRSPLWFIASALYFCAVASGVAVALRGKNGDDSDVILSAVFPVGVAGIVTLFYWVGRPLEFNLLPTLVPAFVLAGLVLDRLPRILVTASSVLGAIGLLGTHEFYLGDRLALFSRARSIPASEWKYDPVIVSAASLIKKYQPDDPGLRLFVRLPRDIPIFLLTGKHDAFGRSNQNDELSEKYMNRGLVAGLKNTKVGSFVFSETLLADFMSGKRQPTSSTDSFTPFAYTAFLAITEKYDLCPIETGAEMMVSITVEKGAACAGRDDIAGIHD
jgi:hypothetical protein